MKQTHVAVPGAVGTAWNDELSEYEWATAGGLMIAMLRHWRKLPASERERHVGDAQREVNAHIRKRRRGEESTLTA